MILHSKERTSMQKVEEKWVLWGKVRFIEYPETRMAILAPFVSNFLVGCNTNVTEGASHSCESRTINLFPKYIAIVFKLRYIPDACDVSHLVISRNCRYIAVLKSPVLFSIQQSTSDLSLVLMSCRPCTVIIPRSQKDCKYRVIAQVCNGARNPQETLVIIKMHIHTD